MLLRFLIVGLVFGFVVVSGQPTVCAQQPAPVVFAWSDSIEGPLFVADAKPKSKDGLIYDRGSFSLRLSDLLSYDRDLDVYSLWLGQNVGEQLVLLRRSAGAYRGNLPGQGDLGLNDFGKLKLLWLSSGERFLFTEINSAWHCVTVEDAHGRKLYVDYDRDGGIALVREGERSVEPVYQSGRMVSVRQMWPSSSGRVLSLNRF